MPTLRTYQEDGLAGISAAFTRGYRRVAYTGPCGSGKTILFAEMILRASQRGRRITVLVHRGELIDQVSRALDGVHVPHGFQAAGCPERHGWTVQIAMVQTLARRLNKYSIHPHLIIVDECHHITAEQYKAVLAHYRNAYVLGVTATLCRLSGAPLGDVFEYHVPGPTTPDLQLQGYLSPCTQLCPPARLDLTAVPVREGDYDKRELTLRIQQSTITGDAVEHYRKYADRRPAVAFCPTVNEAERTAHVFRDAGYAAVSVDGKMDRCEQRRRIRALGSAVNVLTSCSLIDEGVDVPCIECVIDLRPTKSLSGYLQRGGRGLRMSPGKARCVYLDHAGNYHQRTKNGEQFGRIDEPRYWTLDAGAAPVKRLQPLRTCPVCFACYEGPVCPYCGALPLIESSERRGPRVVDGELVEAERVAREAMEADFRDARSLQAMHAAAKKHGKKPGYAWMRWTARQRRKRAGTQTVMSEPERQREFG